MAELALECVTKVYRGGVRAVSDLSLVVRDGEFVVLVGPSGCGKSTTLRLIAGLEELTSGHVRIGGRRVDEVPPRERDVAMVFQNCALYPHLTVAANLGFGLRLRRVRRAEIRERVAATAELLGIADLLNRKPRELSGGQRQRVALGRALVRRPQAFLLDEPLSNLDASLRGELRAELRRLHRELDVTVLYVTHDQEEAISLGQRVAVMKDGAIQQCADPLEVYRRPANRFVAGFIGTPPMNFLHGCVFAEGGTLYFLAGSERIRLPAKWRGPAGSDRRPVVLGFRPESLSSRCEGQACENRLDVTVSAVELLGEKMDIHVRTSAGGRLVCRTRTDSTVHEGMSLPLYLNVEQVHVFEPGDEGLNVSRDESGEYASATA